MKADFAGETALLYSRYRRDLPIEQAHALAERMELGAEDVVVDLGCGTGQLAVPLRTHCDGVIGVDPEPQMLAGLRARGENGVMCVLGDDGDLPLMAHRLAGPVGAVVVGNALHWMDEAATLRACADVVRPGGALAVVTQGPPLWLGPAPWQVAVRQALEEAFGPVSATCGTDAVTLGERVRVLESLGLDVQVANWHVGYEVDADWVIGHLGSALPSGALQDARGGLADTLRAVLDKHHAEVMVEEVTTTAVIARVPLTP